MPNNSKSPLQTRPSTLDIVLKNGQMNLATAIGRLEQAVTKAYGNINSSINSKQGEFNQALLKTLDQSISHTHAEIVRKSETERESETKKGLAV